MFSYLLKVEYTGSRSWWYFYCINIDTNEEFKESGKLSYVGNMLRSDNLNIDKWNDFGFTDVINKMIEFKVMIAWNNDGYNNSPSYIVENDAYDLLKKWICENNGENNDFDSI